MVLRVARWGRKEFGWSKSGKLVKGEREHLGVGYTTTKANFRFPYPSFLPLRIEEKTNIIQKL